MMSITAIEDPSDDYYCEDRTPRRWVITRNTKYIEQIMEAGEFFFSQGDARSTLDIMTSMIKIDKFEKNIWFVNRTQ